RDSTLRAPSPGRASPWGRLPEPGRTPGGVRPLRRAPPRIRAGPAPRAPAGPRNRAPAGAWDRPHGDAGHPPARRRAGAGGAADRPQRRRRPPIARDSGSAPIEASSSTAPAAPSGVITSPRKATDSSAAVSGSARVPTAALVSEAVRRPAK